MKWWGQEDSSNWVTSNEWMMGADAAGRKEEKGKTKEKVNSDCIRVKSKKQEWK